MAKYCQEIRFFRKGINVLICVFGGVLFQPVTISCNDPSHTGIDVDVGSSRHCFRASPHRSRGGATERTHIVGKVATQLPYPHNGWRHLALCRLLHEQQRKFPKRVISQLFEGRRPARTVAPSRTTQSMEPDPPDRCSTGVLRTLWSRVLLDDKHAQVGLWPWSRV